MTQSNIAVDKQEGMYWSIASQTWIWGKRSLFVYLSLKRRLEFFVTIWFCYIGMEFLKTPCFTQLCKQEA